METTAPDIALAAQSGTASNDIQRFTRTLEAARLLQSTLNLRQLTSIILEIVRNEIPVDRVTFFVVDRERKNVCSLVAQGVDDMDISLPMGTGIAGFVAETGQAQDILDVYADARFNPEFDRLLGYKTNDMLAWPILDTDRKVTGVVELLNRKRPITEDDRGFLADVSGFIALALENAVLHEEFRQKVRLETELAQLRERLVQMDRMVRPSGNHRKIQIDVADNGPGIPVQLYERIFEPFFSTKHDTVRSGLGLTIASRIVQEHGGEIVFQSTAGEGSMFTIELPA